MQLYIVQTQSFFVPSFHTAYLDESLCGHSTSIGVEYGTFTMRTNTSGPLRVYQNTMALLNSSHYTHPDTNIIRTLVLPHTGHPYHILSNTPNLWQHHLNCHLGSSDTSIMTFNPSFDPAEDMDWASFTSSIEEYDIHSQARRFLENTTQPAPDHHTTSTPAQVSSTTSPYYITPRTGHTGLPVSNVSAQRYPYPTQVTPATPASFNKSANKIATPATSLKNVNNKSKSRARTTSTTPSRRPKQIQAKNFPCTWEDCPRMFTCPHNVQQHVREKHTGERPNVCEDCGASFPRPYSLNRHAWCVHGKKIGPGRGKVQSNKGNRREQKMQMRKRGSTGSEPTPEQEPLPLYYDLSSSPSGMTEQRHSSPATMRSQHSPSQDDAFAFTGYASSRYNTNNAFQSDSGLDEIAPTYGTPFTQQQQHIYEPDHSPLPNSYSAPAPLNPNHEMDLTALANLTLNNPKETAVSPHPHPSTLDVVLQAQIQHANNTNYPQTNGPITCDECGLDCEDDNVVLEHLHIVHGLERSGICPCVGCALSLANLAMGGGCKTEGDGMGAGDGVGEVDWEKLTSGEV